MPIKNILIVDDSATDRQFLSELLVKNGYKVSTADSAEDALAKVRQHRPDLVLMDVVMPGQNGFQATRMLARDDATKHIPVIICTSKAQETDKVWGMRQGARDYIVKPINQADLLAKIAALGLWPPEPLCAITSASCRPGCKAPNSAARLRSWPCR